MTVATACVMCDEPTTETVEGIIGPDRDAMCTDCQFWCDGNIDA